MNKTFVCGAWSPLLSPGMRHERLVAHLEQGTFYLFFYSSAIGRRYIDRRQLLVPIIMFHQIKKNLTVTQHHEPDHRPERINYVTRILAKHNYAMIFFKKNNTSMSG